MPLPTASFGVRLTALRESRDWSQADLAKRLVVHKTYVSKLEREDRPAHLLPVQDFFRLARVLGCSPWALLTGWDEDEKVDFDLTGIEPMTAAQVWAWADWDASELGLGVLTPEESKVWFRFSPVVGSVDVDLDVLVDLAAEELEHFVEEGLGRPVQVRDPDDESKTVVVFVLDPETKTAFRRRLAESFTDRYEKENR